MATTPTAAPPSQQSVTRQAPPRQRAGGAPRATSDGAQTPSTSAGVFARATLRREPPAPPTPVASEWSAFLRGFVYAGRGIAYAARTQRNMRVHIALGVAAVALGLLLRISPVEFALVFVAITLVFVAEMFNTVVEAIVDLVTAEYHPLARIAKDVAAGAVLTNAILSVVIALFVFVPHLLPLARLLLARV